MTTKRILNLTRLATFLLGVGLAALATIAEAQTEQPPTAHPVATADPGAESYANHCAICHGEQREGILPAFPPLAGVSRQMSDAQIIALIHNGRGRMPGFPKVPQTEVAALVHYLGTPVTATSDTATATNSNAPGAHSNGLAEAGGSLFGQNCAFCHGRDAMGGESGPDLTRSKLVLSDKGGDRISEVVREGRPEKKMPAFNFSNQELLSLATFIHAQEMKAASGKGKRRGVDATDLQTGSVAAGKQYFEGAGTCVKCHSATGDLSGIASRYEGLQLEQRMLYPKDVKNHVTVTLPDGQSMTGTVAYIDEFTLGMRDAKGTYHSWKIHNVKYTVDAPVTAHVALFSHYTDDDIHNLMAYVQTLR